VKAIEQIARGMRYQEPSHPIYEPTPEVAYVELLPNYLNRLPGPNLILWTGTRHALVIELKDDVMPLHLRHEHGDGYSRGDGLRQSLSANLRRITRVRIPNGKRPCVELRD